MDERLVSNVANIFSEITGAVGAASNTDKAAIDFWNSKHGWNEYEFRLSIEHQWKSPTSRTWLMAEPGRINIKTFLNPRNEERTLDIVNDLRRASEIQKKAAAATNTNSSPDIKENRIRCPDCLEVVTVKYFKVPDGVKFKWESDLSEYDRHYVECFDRRIQQAKVM
jgi:hypothetical protein